MIAASDGKIDALSGFRDFENMVYLPRLNKLAIGVKKEGILFIHNMTAKLMCSFVPLRRLNTIHYANAESEEDEDENDKNSKSLAKIANYGFFEYLLLTVGKSTMLAIDPDSEEFLDKEHPEIKGKYIPKKVKFSNGLGEMPRRVI